MYKGKVPGVYNEWHDYICGLTGICMCIMMTFVCAKDSSIKSVQIQNKYAEKNENY